MMLVTTAAKIAPRVALALLWPAALFGQQANSQPQYVPTDELHAKLLSGSPPAWPPEAVSKNMEGSVRIRFVVTKEGAVATDRQLLFCVLAQRYRTVNVAHVASHIVSS